MDATCKPCTDFWRYVNGGWLDKNPIPADLSSWEVYAKVAEDNRRFLYFATKADVEGRPEIASLFRSIAEGETMHAFGHLDFLAELGEWTGLGETSPVVACLNAALELEVFEHAQMYPGFARTAQSFKIYAKSSDSAYQARFGRTVCVSKAGRVRVAAS